MKYYNINWVIGIVIIIIIILYIRKLNQYILYPTVPNKQYMITEKYIPLKSTFIVDESDVEYYKNIQDKSARELNNRLHQQISTGNLYRINQFPRENTRLNQSPREKPRLNLQDINIEYIENTARTSTRIIPEQTRIIPEQTRIIPPTIPQRVNGIIPTNNRLDRFIINDILENDQQNVHDSIIQKSISKEYNSIEKGKNPRILEDIINRNPQHSREIESIIESIKKRNSSIYNLNGDGELNVLENVWNNGNDNVKDQIINELLDCKKDTGDLYCPTGVVSRIIQANFIENVNNIPRTKNVYKEEMLSKASILKEKNLDLTELEFKDLLLNQYSKDYDGILTRDEITNTTKEWIDYI